VSSDSQVPLKPTVAEHTVDHAPAEAGVARTGLGLWLHRLAVLLLVFGCAAVGMLLIILPWSPQWTSNSLLWGSPQWQAVLAHSFVRGVCSGLGILDLWIGFSEAVHYHEGKRP
jgi:hypothetical protein